MTIRKLSIGTDPLKAMHYQVGSNVLGGSHVINNIEYTDFGYDVWIKNELNEIVKWKTINTYMPVIIEHNLDF